MPKIPMQIDSLDIIKGDYGQTVQLSSNNKKYKIKMEKLPFYRNIKEIADQKNKVKFIRYLLTEKNTGIKSLYKNGDYYYPSLIKCMEKIKVQHDPMPDKSFDVFPFYSLESLQWHLIAHGVADTWLNPEEDYLLSDKLDKKEVEQLWNNFIKEVNCPRWSINLPELFNKNQRLCNTEWEKRRKEIAKSHFKDKAHGCLGCLIKGQSQIDTFIKCCKFWGEYRFEYLKKIMEWVSSAIRDHERYTHYEKDQYVLPPGITASRRHLHINKKQFKNICAYYYKPVHNGVSIYHMALWNDYGKYFLTSAYSLNKKKSVDKAIQAIHTHAKKKYPTDTIETCCHKTNWPEFVCHRTE